MLYWVPCSPDPRKSETFCWNCLSFLSLAYPSRRWASAWACSGRTCGDFASHFTRSVGRKRSRPPPPVPSRCRRSMATSVISGRYPLKPRWQLLAPWVPTWVEANLQRTLTGRFYGQRRTRSLANAASTPLTNHRCRSKQHRKDALEATPPAEHTSYCQSETSLPLDYQQLTQPLVFERNSLPRTFPLPSNMP